MSANTVRKYVCELDLLRQFFLCLYALTLSSFYHNLQWLKPNFLIDEFTKCLPIQSVGPSSLYYNLQVPKANFIFSFTEKVFAVEKSPARTESGG